MVQVKSQSIEAGQVLINIGTVQKIELYPNSRLVRIVCTEEKIMSAAFFWYRYDTILFVQNIA